MSGANTERERDASSQVARAGRTKTTTISHI